MCYFFYGSFMLFMYYVFILIHTWTKAEAGTWWNRFKPSNKFFYWPFEVDASFVDHICYFCLVLLCFLARLFIDALWSPAVRGRTSSGVRFWSCRFSIIILGQVCCSIVSIPYLCSLSYFYYICWYIIIKTKDMHTSIRSWQQLFCLYCTCNRIKISKYLFSWGI